MIYSIIIVGLMLWVVWLILPNVTRKIQQSRLEKPNTNPWVIYKKYFDVFEAQIVLGKLRSQNVKCFLKRGDMGGAYPFPFSPSIGHTIFVKKNDLKRI